MQKRKASGLQYGRTIILTAALLLIATLAIPVSATDQAVEQRDLEDAFVDTFLLDDVEPIRAQMPGNWEDPATNLVAATRVDNFDAVIAAAPYSTLEEMLLAFYNNQKAFNNDPSRNHIRMDGSVREVIEEDGTVVVTTNIAYQDLPLSLYNFDNFINSIFVELDPRQLVKILEDGSLNANLTVEMEIPFPGAPLHFWNSYLSGGVRRLKFVGEGEGWLVDENGERTGRAQVHIRHDCAAYTCSKRIVQFTPID